MLSKSTLPHSSAFNFRLMSVHFPMPRNRPTPKIRIYQYEHYNLASVVWRAVRDTKIVYKIVDNFISEH